MPRKLFGPKNPGLMVSILKSVFLIVALTFAIILPGRAGLAFKGEHSQVGFPSFLVGITLDFKCVIVFVTLIVLTALIITRLSRKPFLGILWTAALSFSLTAYGIGCAEFYQERGGFPSLFDVLNSRGDMDFYRSYLPIALRGQYFYPLLASLILAILLLLPVHHSLGLATRKYKSWQTLTGAFAILLTSTAISSTAFWVFANCKKIFPHIQDRDYITSAYEVSFFLGAKSSIANGFKGTRAWVESIEPAPESATLGARYLGLDSAQTKSCPNSAWAIPLEDVLRPSTGHTQASLALKTFESETALLSRTLDPNRTIVWHIILESFRGDDIHALNINADPELTPFFNSVYQGTHPLLKNHKVFAFTHMYQGGTRTSQGLSASLCGLGTLPFGLSITRDLENSNLTCLPKAFHEMGFDSSFVYGASAAFDSMNRFFTEQKSRIYSKGDFSEDSPIGGWGISDRAMLGNMEQIALRSHVTPNEGEVKNQYFAFLSLSNHSPSKAPDDFPAELGQSVEAIRARVKVPLSEWESDRIVTFRYTDFAVGEFIERIQKGPLGKNSVFILQADHATGEPSMWLPSEDVTELTKAKTYAQIPFLMIGPESSAAAHTQSNLVTMNAPFSENDIPRLILKMLSQFQPLQTAQRNGLNVTLGSQALGLDKARVSPFPEASIWGINAAAEYFAVDAEGEMNATRLKMNPPTLANMPVSKVPGDEAILSTLADYFRGLNKVCLSH